MKHLITAALIALAGPVVAQCYERDAMKDILRNDHYLNMRFGGLTADGNLIEIWIDESGNWVATATYANGMMCAVSDGYAGDFFLPKGEKL